MPLDGGHSERPADGSEPLTPSAHDRLYAHATLGEALRAVRLDRGLSLEELAEATRVRKSYLEAIEETRLEALPSRPFTIGYIRAYAEALGLDPEGAVDRFRAEEPVLDEPLRAPVGVPDEKDPRIVAFVVGAVVIVAAIVLWNVAQRAMSASAPPPPKAPESFAWKVLAKAKPEPVRLGDPLPAPVESTIPPAYETPGLAEAGPDGKGNDASPANINDMSLAPVVDIATLPPTFVPKGRIYESGAPQLPSLVVIQALEPGALIVRGADGSVYFARQFNKGEAYKVPHMTGLTLDVSDPNSFQVFVQGQSKGVLPSKLTLATKLVG